MLDGRIIQDGMEYFVHKSLLYYTLRDSAQEETQLWTSYTTDPSSGSFFEPITLHVPLSAYNLPTLGSG